MIHVIYILVMINYVHSGKAVMVQNYDSLNQCEAVKQTLIETYSPGIFGSKIQLSVDYLECKKVEYSE